MMRKNQWLLQNKGTRTNSSKRDLNDQNIGETGSSNSEETREKARRSGMTKGTAGAAETGDEYEQGAAGTNK
jgi:hypothetical protein